MGIRKRMTLSTGEQVAPRAKDWQAIAAAQCKVEACRRGSNNRRKAVKQLRRTRRRQSVSNRNACHRVTANLVQRYGMIAVEKLRIGDMTRSAAGTLEEPGKNVTQKSGLNRSIQEQTWGLLRAQLAYKAEWAGRQFIEVDPRNTSRDCSRCGARHNPGTSERYDCPACGVSMDRDVNAAVNILRAGTLALAERQNGMQDSLCM